MNITDSVLSSVLSKLEDLEIPLLNWGVVDGSLSLEEVEDVIYGDVRVSHLDEFAQGLDPTQVLRELVERGLLFELPEPGPPRYRTRLGEGLRLLRNLRQLFPPRDMRDRDWWLGGAQLVADYRLRVSPRLIPKRELSIADVTARVSQSGLWAASLDGALERVVGTYRLAAFQSRCFRQIWQDLSRDRSAGVMITAGTGSGKTLAAYLPLLLHVLGSGKSRSGLHTLSLYPRKELLRDQAREVLAITLRLNDFCDRSGLPRMRVGLLYGATPWTPSDVTRGHLAKAWPKVSSGRRCPYFSCVREHCNGDMIWRDEDVSREVERLHCSRCDLTIDDSNVLLTRRRLATDAPDVLFTTTEMMHRSATHPDIAPLLGWKRGQRLRAVLIDEAHTYAGTQGAQVALMLRRWRQAQYVDGVKSHLFVGLSATLREAPAFFAELTGIDPTDIAVEGPSGDELETVGRQYDIVVRADPVSGASVLSTTIQVAMLMNRLLDLEPGLFGASSFAFTDDLDVTNRLFDNLRDAEGRPNRYGRPSNEVLADLRDPDSPQAGRRYQDGQSWELPRRLGRLDNPLRIGRTSSQDSGVDANADVVVATASLEVGFNDPRVGLVIQHKAPRESASFIQRRGRAGRRVTMRPFTVVVLSDYGRDRLAYQTYEQLLDPELQAQSLPVRNAFVLKIQAANSLLDWLGRRSGADARSLLTRPRQGRQISSSQANGMLRLLRLLQQDSQVRADLAWHLRRSLGIDDQMATEVLWSEPRSLLLSVVPTAIRQLESRWRTLTGDEDPGASDSAPLPAFITESLFGALNTPDVAFRLPGGMADADVPPMEIAQALREAIPGRVSRRFGFTGPDERTWVPVPKRGEPLELARFVTSGQRLGTWQDGSGHEYQVVRPLEIALERPPEDVADHSNADAQWESQFVFPSMASSTFDVPSREPWKSAIQGVNFCLHGLGQPLHVRRMTTGSRGEVAVRVGKRAERQSFTAAFAIEGSPAALGWSLDADAMVIDASFPAQSDLVGFARSPSWRTLAFFTMVREDVRLDGLTNVFQREWLARLFIAAYALKGAAGEGRTATLSEVTGGKWAAGIGDFLAATYMRSSVDRSIALERTAAALADLSARPDVQQVIDEHAKLLVSNAPEKATWDLLRRCYADSLSAAVMAAVGRVSPKAREGDLVADVLTQADSETFKIVISETSSGGLGILSDLQVEYLQAPQRFWQIVESSFAESEYEVVDRQMRQVLSSLTADSDQLEASVASYRSARGAELQEKALREIIDAWTQVSGRPSHLLVATFAARILRPGATPLTDETLQSVVDAWVQLESELGIEVDAQVIAYAASQGRLARLQAEIDADSLYSLLWLRGAAARNLALRHWQPYVQNQLIERLVLASLLHTSVPRIDTSQHDWQTAYVNAMGSGGEVELTSSGARDGLALATLMSLAIPIEVDGLRLYGSVNQVRSEEGLVCVRVSLGESDG